MTSFRAAIRSTLAAVPALCLTLLWATPADAQDLLIRGGTVLTITNGDLPDTDVLIRDGKIAEIGRNLDAPEGIRVINARGRISTSCWEHDANLQRRRLEAEGIAFGPDDRVDLKVYRWEGLTWPEMDELRHSEGDGDVG